MKQILAVIKPYLVEKVIAAIGKLPYEEISIHEVKGFGRQKNYLESYKDNEYAGVFVPKIELSIWCEDKHEEQIVNALIGISRTGRLGDGKILVLPAQSRQNAAPKRP